MRKYFIHNGTSQEGPFDLNMLKEKKILKTTSVWYEGLPDWTTADKIEELKELFTDTPPPFKTSPPPLSSKKETQASPKKTTSWRSIFLKTAVTFFIIIGILFTINALFGRDDFTPNNYEEKVMTVEEMERADPPRFLEVTGSVHENFWGDKIKIKGTVFNKATVANFKDVVLEVTFYSKTKSVIATERYVLYEFFNAHSNKDFFLKVTNWKGTHSVGCVAVEAIPN